MEGFVRFLKGTGIPQKHTPAIGKLQGHVPYKQGRPQFLFQVPKPAAKGLLGYVELFRCPGDTPFPVYDEKILNMGKVHDCLL